MDVDNFLSSGSAPITASCDPKPSSTLTSSSSSLTALLPLDKDLAPLSWSFSQSEQRICRGQEEVNEKKRRLRNYSGEGEEEDNGGRFVGQMRVSVRGGAAEEEVRLTLHDVNHRRRKQGRVCPSQNPAAIVRHNGYR